MITAIVARAEYERAVRALEYSRDTELVPSDTARRTPLLVQNVKDHLKKLQACEVSEKEMPL